MNRKSFPTNALSNGNIFNTDEAKTTEVFSLYLDEIW